MDFVNNSTTFLLAPTKAKYSSLAMSESEIKLVAGSFAGIIFAYQFLKRVFPTFPLASYEHNEEGRKQNEAKRERLCIELAIMPVRILLIILTAPVLLEGFLPVGCFNSTLTDNAMTAWWLVAATYTVDVFIGRAELLSFIHHFGTVLICIWIRTCLVVGTPDALMLRILSVFLFFGVGFAGSCTTCLWVIHKYLKAIYKNSPILSRASTVLIYTLTLNTALCGLYAGCFIVRWKNEFYTSRGVVCDFLLFLIAGETWMQWRWVWMWHAIDARFHQSVFGKAATAAPKISTRLHRTLVCLCIPTCLAGAYMVGYLLERHLYDIIGSPLSFPLDSGLYCTKPLSSIAVTGTAMPSMSLHM
jgi:hypothetical protein